MPRSGLSLHLQDKHDTFLNGLMLVSLAIDMQTLCFDHGNELPCSLFIPTFAATAWYHQALVPELQKKPLADVVATAGSSCEAESTPRPTTYVVRHPACRPDGLRQPQSPFRAFVRGLSPPKG